MRIDTPSPATSPPIPSTTARKQSPVSALECIERLWIVFSWYSAWHFPGDLDHMADTAVFRFLSDTRLVKQKTTACLSPASRHVTTLGHRCVVCVCVCAFPCVVCLSSTHPLDQTTHTFTLHIQEHDNCRRTNTRTQLTSRTQTMQKNKTRRREPQRKPKTLATQSSSSTQRCSFEHNV